MELTQIQQDWRNANETAKSAYKNHQSAIQTYRDKQTAKNWFPDYDLIAQTNGALNQLQSAYNAMHQLAAVLYNEVMTLQQSGNKAHIEPLRTVTGYSTIKQAYWEFFIVKALPSFAADNCLPEDKKAIIELMQKDVESVPALKKVIDFLTAKP